MKRLLIFTIANLLFLTNIVAKGEPTYFASYFASIMYEGDENIVYSDTAMCISSTSKDKSITLKVTHINPQQQIDRIIALTEKQVGSYFTSILHSVGSAAGSLANNPEIAQAENMLAEMDLLSASGIEGTIQSIKYITSIVEITNNTNNEIVVNDLHKGLTWYIKPHSSTSFAINNPSSNSYRIASVTNNAEALCYAKINLASSILKGELLQEVKRYKVLKRENGENEVVYYLCDKYKGKSYKFNEAEYKEQSKDNFFNFVKSLEGSNK